MDFELTKIDERPEDDGMQGNQCDAVNPPYRCVQSMGHTGKHVTWNIRDGDAWTLQYYVW